MGQGLRGCFLAWEEPHKHPPISSQHGLGSHLCPGVRDALTPRTCLQHPKTSLTSILKPAQPVAAALLPAPSSLLFLCPRHVGTALERGQGWSLVLTLFLAHHQPLLPSLARSPLTGGWRVQKDPRPCGDTGVTQLVPWEV